MERNPGTLTAIPVALTALAGFVDAVVFSMTGFFANAMSANSTRLGVALGGGVAGEAAIAAGLLLAFVAGVIGAAVVAHASGARRPTAVLILITLMLALAAGLNGVVPLQLDLLLAAAAMGAVARESLTSMTGALVELGDRLAAALMGEAPRLGWLPYLGLWIGFAAGAVMGAGVYVRIGTAALWVAGGAAAVMTIATSLSRAE